MRIIGKFIVSRCAFCKLWRNFVFFCSVNHLSGPLGKLAFFEAFYDLSYSCLLPSTKIRLVIAISFAILEQFGVILDVVFAGQAGSNDWRNRKTPSKFANTQRNTTNLAIVQMGYRIFCLVMFFLPKKTQLNEITIVYRHYLSRIIFFLYTTQRIPLISSLYD